MNETHLTTEQLIDYAHGELPAHEDAAVHTHLANCNACAETHEAEVRLGEVLRAHAKAWELEMPPGLATAIYANAASHREPSWWERLAAAFRPAVAIPLAAAILLAAYFGITGRHGTTIAENGAIDAAYYLEDHAALATTMPFEEGSAIPAELTSGISTANDSSRP